jgi:hypothetical protein
MAPAARQTLSIEISRTVPAAWEDLLARSPTAGFFHGRCWNELVARHVSGQAPLWLVVHEGSDPVGGLVLTVRRWLGGWRLDSSHEGTPGGPLLVDGLPPVRQREIVSALLAELGRLRALGPGGLREVSLVLTGPAEVQLGPLVRAEPGWQTAPISAAFLPLTGGLAHVERHVFRKNRRNERNRALRRGCVGTVTTDPDVLERYFEIYLAAARRWRIHPAPLGLLRDLLVAEGDAVFLSTVTCDGELLGGHLNFHRGRRVTAWLGATVPEHSDKFPATLLIWTDLVEACRRGAEVLDLGGDAGIASLARFKRMLGAQIEPRAQYTRSSRLLRLARGVRDGLRGSGGRRGRPESASRPERAEQP